MYNCKNEPQKRRDEIRTLAICLNTKMLSNTRSLCPSGGMGGNIDFLSN